MTTTEPIFGGYYIKARKISNSAIAHAAPHVREIWDWLIKSAQHKPYKTSNKTIARGQVLTTYEEIAHELHWMVGFIKKVYKKHHIDFSMRWLRQEGMIATQKTTRGFIVTICNYEYYQDQKNYDYDYENTMITTPLRQGRDTINKNDNNVNNEKDIRGTGDLASPVNPADVKGFNYLPNDRSYIEPTYFYTKADFNGLPDEKNKAVRTTLFSLKQIETEPETIRSLWESFKELELTFQKPYRNKEGVYKHFSNWVNTRPFKKKATAKPAIKKTSKTHGIEFINDFAECRMNDGSVVELDQNQRDLAQFNGISPSSIIR